MFAYTKIMQGIQAVSAAVTDAYFNLVTLLLPGNGTNGAQNNTFLDSSSNNFTITRNGNTTQGTFSPFSQTGWSNYFNGSSRLGLPSNTALRPDVTFTLECWVNVSSYPASDGIYGGGVIAAIQDTDQNMCIFDIKASGVVAFGWINDGITSYSVTSTAALTKGVWYHVAVTKSSNSLKLYLDGVLQETKTTTGTLRSGGTLSLGGSNQNTSYLTGYISNLRLTNTVVYSAAFTPPTSPLTAVTGTALLTCQSNRFVDNSSNAFAITVNGTPSVQAFSPFAPTAAYSAATNGGSGYFDNTGDYLTVASNAAFDMGTGDFTWEGWAYIPSDNSGSAVIAINGAELFFRSVIASSATSYNFSQWNHIAVTRSGTTLRVYLNGVSGTSATHSSSVGGASSTLYIGSYTDGTSDSMYGYLTDVRIVKGTAVYTGTTLTVPTSPLTAISGTSLLLNYTNAGITDATAKNDLETVGNAQISTTQSKFGGSSMAFDGTGDWLLLPHTVDQMLGTGAFTIEMWVYRNSSGTYGLVGKGTSTTGWLVSLNSSNQVVFTYGSSTITSTGTISATTWTYIAVVREGTGTNQTKIYISGSNDGTGTVSTDFTQTNGMYVGADRTGGSAFNGYIDDLRITKGYARTIATPSSAFALQ